MENKSTSLKRIIVDYKKLTPEILAMLVEKYPDGYDDDDVIVFKNAKNETIEAVELRTEECIYLVKVSTRLQAQMENFDLDEYNESESDSITDLPEGSEGSTE